MKLAILIPNDYRVPAILIHSGGPAPLVRETWIVPEKDAHLYERAIAKGGVILPLHRDDQPTNPQIRRTR